MHPTKGHPTGTLSNALTAHMASRGERYKVRFANRLDMDTTGIVLACKNAFVQDNFVKQGDRVEKVYEALVRGEAQKDRGRISLPITKNGEGGPRREVDDSGREATTEYEVIRRFTVPAARVSAASDAHGLTAPAASVASDATAALADEPLTHIRLFLRTGRTHQLRVHLAHIGHPILGDSLYGIPSALISRQALHAKTLRFTHPVSGEEMEIEAALPEDMAKILI
jgi:23S rRNA pseudouridine1911/1915/1917 synthase